MQVRVDLVLHVTRQETQFLPGLDGGAREDDLPHLLVLQRTHSQRYARISLAAAGRSRSKDHVRLGIGFDQPLLILRTRRDGLALHAIYQHALHTVAPCLLPPEDMEDILLRQLVVADAMLLQFVHVFIEGGQLFFIAHHLDDIASGHDAQFGVKGLHHLHIHIVDPIEKHGVNVLQNDMFFCHSVL